jgi:hypothetical protein
MEKTMTCVAITKRWYDEIKGLVKMENEYFYVDEMWGEEVEVDVDEEEFNRVSRELGWML